MSDRLLQIARQEVLATQRGLPAPLQPALKAVAVHFERTPAPDVLAEGFPPDILGLFSGSPHGNFEDQPMPPQITLYLDNLLDYAEGDEEAFREEVRVTFLHELGHYLGWDEDEVGERGLE